MGSVLLIAFAIVLVIEGLGPMLFPKRWRNYIGQIAQLPIEQLRTVGGIMVTIGAVTLFFLL